MINTPFWIAHTILWIAWLIGTCSKRKVLSYFCDWIVAGCFGAMLMYTLTEMI